MWHNGQFGGKKWDNKGQLSHLVDAICRDFRLHHKGKHQKQILPVSLVINVFSGNPYYPVNPWSINQGLLFVNNPWLFGNNGRV
jgi:hypothetical protein